MTYELTDLQQAIFGLLIFILPAFGTWCGLGFPTDKAALGLLASAILSGILVFLKELAGWKPSNGE